MTALIIGTVIALLAIAFVLLPLFREDSATVAESRESGPMPASGEGTDAVGALREIEFDRATGKLSDTDYDALKARYTGEALDLAEQAILRYRRRVSSCGECGPRPEPDAVYCSTCGRYLAGRCGGCGAAVNEPAARFCATCGKTLAA